MRLAVIAILCVALPATPGCKQKTKSKPPPPASAPGNSETAPAAINPPADPEPLAVSNAPSTTPSTTEPAPEAPTLPTGGFASRDALVAAPRISAINANDRPALEATLHPSCLAAITPQNEAMFERLFTKELANTVPAEHELTYIDYNPANNPDITAGIFAYPVEPHHEVRIRYEPSYHVFNTLIWPIASDRGKWFVIAPVPTAKLMRQLADQEAMVDQARSQAAILISGLDETVRNEIVALINEGRTNLAGRTARQRLECSMLEARQVVELLQEELGIEKEPQP